jgi:hypothetical protein
MLLSVYQAVLSFRRPNIERKSLQKAKTSVSPSPVKRMSAFATCMSKGLEQRWNVPSNDPKIRAEIDLFPKRIM